MCIYTLAVKLMKKFMVGLSMRFKVGDIIEFCGEEFEVLECYDDTSGMVKENCEDGCIINNFYWTYEGIECKLVT